MATNVVDLEAYRSNREQKVEKIESQYGHPLLRGILFGAPVALAIWLAIGMIFYFAWR